MSDNVLDLDAVHTERSDVGQAVSDSDVPELMRRMRDPARNAVQQRMPRLWTVATYGGLAVLLVGAIILRS